MGLQKLIEKPNCGLKCPEGREFFCCREFGCKKSYYTDGEMNRRFTEEEKKLIESLWDEKMGFLRNDGCALPRKLMPKACLEYNCHNVKRSK